MRKMMKAIVLTRFGGPDALRLESVPVPVPRAHEVLVRVMATSINPLDYQIRRGDYPTLVSPPAIIGHDVSGIIEQVGEGVTEFATGDEVYYTPKIFSGPGSYAQFHAADVGLVSRKPQGLSHAQAASMTLVGGTVIEALLTRAKLQVGETILICGGAGGVATAAIQLARACGTQVIATTTRRSNRAFLEELGAHAIVDVESEDVADRVLELTGGRGVDVLLDCVGGDTLTIGPKVLVELGRVVSIVDTPRPQNLVEAWGRNATYYFVFTRQYRGKLEILRDLLERRLIRPVIGATMGLEDVPQAHALLEAGSRESGLKGKIAIEVTH